MNLRIETTYPVFPPGAAKTSFRDLIRKVIQLEGKKFGELTVILTDDPTIVRLNRDFLKRENTTDVLAFDLTEPDDEKISGEIYISVEQAKKQAAQYGVSLKDEILRLAVHGLLHLSGYSDRTSRGRLTMTGREDYYLGLRKKMGDRKCM
ncbi:rRNA maturation RNase YbeY [candidate division KSB1 bacterium]|nr:rRNA maturation RNase YbeY [candidate division KSB1 bacterium]